MPDTFDIHGSDEAAAAVAAAGIGHWRWDLKEKKAALSDIAADLMKTESRDLPQDEFLALLDPNDRSAVRHSLECCLGQGKMYDVVFRLADGANWRRMRGGTSPDKCQGAGILLDIP